MSDNGDTPSPRSSTGATGSMSPPPARAPESTSSPKKRTQSTSVGTDGKVTKRRAARACASCRARKVRCDVVEGVPCNNCRWDSVECIVQESRRRKKHLPYNCGPASVGARSGTAEALRTKSIGAAPPISITANLAKQPAFASPHPFTVPLNGEQAAPRLSVSYQQPVGGYRPVVGDNASPSLSGFVPLNPGIPAGVPLLHPLLKCAMEQPTEWPIFIKPIPDRISSEDRYYLLQKQVLTLPHLRLQNGLLKAYVEYVHPYMPLLELHEFLKVVNDRTGASGKVSLFLYHAVMFAATAFVDESLLKEAGYESRRDARRTFFSRTRLLYDFDYETDRLILVQGLLLMTYWYETPDDSKDTWHWMGIAISLAHTIGLHRNPAKTPMTPRKQKLWKRVWWSCFMRDRLIALGMRRPTRIKGGDFDVPLLEESDFELEVLPEDNQLLGPDCALIRDVEMQRELAVMCIEKAKLCQLIGEVLQVQYCVLSRAGMRPEHTTNSTHMLLPNKKGDNMEDVEEVDKHLREWYQNPPDCCRYRPLDPLTITDGNKPLAVQRNLLHMVYHTTISALHRPLFLPASPTQAPNPPLDVQETARQRVREAAEHITCMVAEMRRHGLERFLPTTGVTVILPATIIHMLDMKNLDLEARVKAAQGLKECLTVMSNLRNIYAAADFATGFLDAALRSFLGSAAASQHPAPQAAAVAAAAARSAKLNRVLAPALNLAPAQKPQRPSTPPPDSTTTPFLNPTEINLFHPAAHAHQNNTTHTHNHNHAQTFVPATALDADGDVVFSATGRGDTPPHTDYDDDAPPSSSIGDADVDVDVDALMADQLVLGMGMSIDNYTAVAAAAGHHGHSHEGGVCGGGAGAGAGNAAGGGNGFDFDQWLQFPAEGGGGLGVGSDDAFMGGMFGEQSGGGCLGELKGEGGGMEWLGVEGLGH